MRVIYVIVNLVAQLLPDAPFKIKCFELTVVSYFSYA